MRNGNAGKVKQNDNSQGHYRNRIENKNILLGRLEIAA